LYTAKQEPGAVRRAREPAANTLQF